jgi:hypothetical protein
MMFINSYNECYNLSLAHRIYRDGTVVRADFGRNSELIESFDNEQQAIDFIRYIAKEMNK